MAFKMSSSFGPDQPEDTDLGPLTAKQIDSIAERAADKAVAKLTGDVYKAIGRSIVDKLFWIVGALAVALYFWAQGKGLLK